MVRRYQSASGSLTLASPRGAGGSRLPHVFIAATRATRTARKPEGCRFDGRHVQHRLEVVRLSRGVQVRTAGTYSVERHAIRRVSSTSQGVVEIMASPRRLRSTGARRRSTRRDSAYFVKSGRTRPLSRRTTSLRRFSHPAEPSHQALARASRSGACFFHSPHPRAPVVLLPSYSQPDSTRPRGPLQNGAGRIYALPTRADSGARAAGYWRSPRSAVRGSRRPNADIET